MARDLRTYSSYRQMLNRCLNTNNHNYHLYGGRGIKICDRWLNSYANFLEDMGVRPEGTTLDRKDNDGDYCLNNCRWSTHAEQCYNRGTSHWLIFHYNNTRRYTDNELVNYKELDDLKSTMDEMMNRYPLSKIKGGIKFISSQDDIATFAILKELSDKDVPIGGRINRLTLIEPLEVGKRNLIKYAWRCDCGKTITAYSHHVVDDDRQSCGCHRRESSAERGYVEGYKSTDTYKSWQNMRLRCNNPRYKNHPYTVCAEWGKFENFLSDMGHPETKGASLRLKDGETVYSKSNCYWDNETRL